MSINLIPKEVLQKEKSRKIDTAIFSGIFFLAFIGLFFYGIRFFAYKGVEADIKKLNRDLAQLKVLVKKVEEIEISYNQLSNRLKVINELFENKYLYAKFMERVVNKIPDNLWISSINTTKEADRIKINCNAFALTNYIVARFMRKLIKSKHFSDVELFYVQSAPIASTSVVEFNVTCFYSAD